MRHFKSNYFGYRSFFFLFFFLLFISFGDAAWVCACVCVFMLTIRWTIQMFEFQSSANRIHMIFAVLDRNFHWRHLLKFSYARNWFEILVLCSAFEIDSTFTNRFYLLSSLFFCSFFFFCSPVAAAFQFIKTQIKCSLPESLYVYTLYRVWYVPKTDAGGRERKKRKKELVQRNHLDRSEYGMCCSLVWFDLIQYSFCRASAHKS